MERAACQGSNNGVCCQKNEIEQSGEKKSPQIPVPWRYGGALISTLEVDKKRLSNELYLIYLRSFFPASNSFISAYRDKYKSGGGREAGRCLEYLKL